MGAGAVILQFVSEMVSKEDAVRSLCVSFDDTVNCLAMTRGGYQSLSRSHIKENRITGNNRETGLGTGLFCVRPVFFALCNSCCFCSDGRCLQ